MIREGLLDSERYWSVTIEAQRMFFHMLLLADDFGCISVSPTFLRRRCFSDSPSVERISKLLNELIDVDLIRTYEVDRSCYAFIPRFGQRLQRETLKHPQPNESLYQDDVHALEKFNKIKNKTTNPTVGQPLPTVGQPPEEKRREEKEAMSVAKEVLDFLNATAGRSFEAVPANLELITARLKEGATVEQCKQVVSCKTKEWKGTDMAKFLRPATLFNRLKYAQYVGDLGVETRRVAI